MRAPTGEGLEQQRLEIVKFERFMHHLVGPQVERAFRRFFRGRVFRMS